MVTERAAQLISDIKDDIRLGLATYAYEDTVALIRLLWKLGVLRGMTPVRSDF